MIDKQELIDSYHELQGGGANHWWTITSGTLEECQNYFRQYGFSFLKGEFRFVEVQIIYHYKVVPHANTDSNTPSRD